MHIMVMEDFWFEAATHIYGMAAMERRLYNGPNINI